MLNKEICKKCYRYRRKPVCDKDDYWRCVHIDADGNFTYEVVVFVCDPISENCPYALEHLMETQKC